MGIRPLRFVGPLLAGIGVAAAWAQTPQWLLMSRHGECTDANRALQHRVRDLPVVSGPDHFAGEMKNRGLAVKVTHTYGGNRDAVLVEVPERDMSVLFVRPALCREILRK